jgi:hypothetical protein
MSVWNQYLDNHPINHIFQGYPYNNIINDNLNNNQNDLIPLNDFPIVEVDGDFFTANQLLQELNNWIDGAEIRKYLKAMIDVELLHIDLDAGVNLSNEYIINVNNNYLLAENIIFTNQQNDFIEKVSKFIELCNIDEMRDFIIYMNQLF